MKPELYRLYAVLAQHGGDPDGFTPEYWLKRSLGQAREHAEKYAELLASLDLGQLYARSDENRRAREVLSSVSGYLVEGSDEPVVKQVNALLEELGHSGRSRGSSRKFPRLGKC